MRSNEREKLVIGLSSSALFDLKESDSVFRSEGVEKYRQFQRDNQDNPLLPGCAFPFVRKLLSLNDMNPSDPPVTVVLLSRNCPDTGCRVMKSIRHHNLNISRALFLQGGDPHRYISPMKIDLFLSANETDVRQALLAGHPAGHVLETDPLATDDDALRISFDFDGVVVDDEAESLFQRTANVELFNQHEIEKAAIPHNPGPLGKFLKKISILQAMEITASRNNPDYTPRIHISIVTARSTPAHERTINTMRAWGIAVNEAFFLGGMKKDEILAVLKPHIFFDDQLRHLQPLRNLTAVHIPIGAANSPALPTQ